jgi:serine protease inhibitor
VAALDESKRQHLRFCLTLHRAVASGSGDSCFSPYSVASALGLTSRAARGKAAEELISLLAGSDADIAKQAELLHGASALKAQPGREAPVLAVSNTLWAWDELPLNEGFLDELASWPGGRVATAPFISDPEQARRVINADVAKTTRGLIPELLPPGAIRSDVVAALVNALYLRVAWIHPFGTGATEPADFHAPGGTRRVPMMRQSESFGYAAGDGWQVVVLPGAGGTEAVVLLPDGDLARQEAELDEVMLAQLLQAPSRRTVQLSLPKIKLDVRSPLTQALKGLGVGTMFTSEADFSPLTPDPRLEVADVLHQAVLRVDEQGFEGAAATAVTFRLVSMSTDEPVTVEVNRPFLLLVRHAETGVVYFFSRIVDP